MKKLVKDEVRNALAEHQARSDANESNFLGISGAASSSGDSVESRVGGAVNSNSNERSNVQGSKRTPQIQTRLNSLLTRITKKSGSKGTNRSRKEIKIQVSSILLMQFSHYKCFRN